MHDLTEFRKRLQVAATFSVILFIILLVRLFLLQIVTHEDFHTQAEDNRISVVPIVPNRGMIVDRKGIPIAHNYSAYTLELTPKKIADLEQTITELGKIVEIQPKDKKRFKRLLDETKGFGSLAIRSRLTDEEVARFTAHSFRFDGVEVKARLFRQYPLNEAASHVVGYIGRVNIEEDKMIENLLENPNYYTSLNRKLTKREKDILATFKGANMLNYKGTEHIGKIGIEQSYEKDLHGTTGFEKIEVTAGGKAIRTLSRTDPVSGNNLILSLDVELQKIIEESFGDRRGALVAIEPKTGDILAFVSKPTFDPNLFVDGIDTENWNALNTSLDKPLLNRPLRGTYPPGSTYKPFMALAALTLGVRTPTQSIRDPGYYMFGNHRFRDDKPGGHGTVNMYDSIVHSCDTYYYVLANDLGVDRIHDYMEQWKFGGLTEIDIFGESTGILPSTKWKQKARGQKWIAGETISIGIGQGYNSFTPLQMAHAMATLANNGVIMKPHLVKAIENIRTNSKKLVVSEPAGRINAKQSDIDLIKNALVGVNISGTSSGVFAGTPYQVAGKTGTAQVITIKQNEKYVASNINERHRDHSWYVAFAPADNPKIALAVIVENGGFGAASAAPLARQALDFYLLGKRPKVIAKEEAVAE